MLILFKCIRLLANLKPQLRFTAAIDQFNSFAYIFHGYREALIGQLQQQVSDLTLFLEEERLNHKATKDKVGYQTLHHIG